MFSLKNNNLHLYLKQVRDTSRFSAFETVKHPLETAQKFRKKPQDALSGVVLNVSQCQSFLIVWVKRSGEMARII